MKGNLNADLMLFDLDGVLLSEASYLDAASLTIADFVERWTKRDNDFVPLTNLQEQSQLRVLREAFMPDLLLAALRERAINSNWDKAYAGVLLYLQIFSTQRESAEFALEAVKILHTCSGVGQDLLRDLDEQVKALVDVGSLSRALYGTSDLLAALTDRFQVFFRGQKTASTVLLQGGLMAFEKSLVDVDQAIMLLQQLRVHGITLGIGTGRPRIEAMQPLRKLGLWEYFSESSIRTIDEVEMEEGKLGLPHHSLSKPHPFTYQHAAQGYAPQSVCVVGDSPADLAAAQSAGFQFVGIGDKKMFGPLWTYGRAYVPSVLDLPIPMRCYNRDTK